MAKRAARSMLSNRARPGASAIDSTSATSSFPTPANTAIAPPRETTLLATAAANDDDDDHKARRGISALRLLLRPCLITINALAAFALASSILSYHRASSSSTTTSLRSAYATTKHRHHRRRHNFAPIILNGDPTFSLALDQSYGFFYDVPAEHWELCRRIFRQHVNHRFPELPWTYHPDAAEEESRPEIYANRDGRWKHGWSSVAAWYQNNYEPNFSCQFEKRVGEPMNGDGGKWVCDPHRIRHLAEARKTRDPNHPGCVVYSIGSNGDFTFEVGLEKEVGEGICEFHIFDMENFEPIMKKSGLKRAYFHKWGLEKQLPRPNYKNPMKRKDGNYYGLLDTVKLLGHENLDVIDLFKIDCEGCEWRTYKDWISDEVPILHQILVEVHNAPKDKALDFYDSLERSGYLRFHKEPNIQWSPECIEYAFVRVDTSFVEGKKL